MTEENAEQPEKKPLAPLYEILVENGTGIAIERGMKLPELIGHFSIAYREVFTRQLAALRNQQVVAQNQPDAPSEDAGTEPPVALVPDEGADKDES